MKWTFKIVLFILTLGFCLQSETSHAQLKSYSFEKLDSLQSQQKRTVLVFIHTDWCKFCQAMKNTTLKNKEIIKELNKKFYFITFNAEFKETIRIKNKLFRFKPSGNDTGIHELAEELALNNGIVTFPTCCFLNPENEIIYQISNYVNSKELLNTLIKLR